MQVGEPVLLVDVEARHLPCVLSRREDRDVGEALASLALGKHGPQWAPGMETTPLRDGGRVWRLPTQWRAGSSARGRGNGFQERPRVRMLRTQQDVFDGAHLD